MAKKIENVVAEIIVVDVRPGADGCRTGKGAGFLTEIEARADFGARKQALAVPKGTGKFLLDLQIGDEIVDTIEIDAAGYRDTVGEEPQTVEKNVAYDRRYWNRAMQVVHAIDKARSASAN